MSWQDHHVATDGRLAGHAPIVLSNARPVVLLARGATVNDDGHGQGYVEVYANDLEGDSVAVRIKLERIIEIAIKHGRFKIGRPLKNGGKRPEPPQPQETPP